MDPLVALIAARPGLPDRLMSEHRTDDKWKCRVCTLGGQAGHQVWPCNIYRAAKAAKKVQEEAAAKRLLGEIRLRSRRTDGSST